MELLCGAGEVPTETSPARLTPGSFPDRAVLAPPSFWVTPFGMALAQHSEASEIINAELTPLFSSLVSQAATSESMFKCAKLGSPIALHTAPNLAKLVSKAIPKLPTRVYQDNSLATSQPSYEHGGVTRNVQALWDFGFRQLTENQYDEPLPM